MTFDPEARGLRQLAARWRDRRVGLLGGSFNPAHDGHIHLAREALRRLDLDAVWLMVSPGNPLKPVTGMAPFEARLEYTAILARHPRIFPSDVEYLLGTNRTAETLEQLQRRMPLTDFVWLMGADNLVQFHHWFCWTKITRQLPIAIFDRPGYPVAALASKFASRLQRYRVPPDKLLERQKGRKQTLPRWSFIQVPRHPMSATAIRAGLGLDWYRS